MVSSSGGSFSSIAAARSGGHDDATAFRLELGAPHRGRDHRSRSVPVPDHAGSANHLTEFTAEDHGRLALGRKLARRRSGPTETITDGSRAFAPDIGAVISGRPIPRWGRDAALIKKDFVGDQHEAEKAENRMNGIALSQDERKMLRFAWESGTSMPNAFPACERATRQAERPRPA